MVRLDEFGYRRFGVKDRWCVHETIDMLTCLEMEINGYFTGEDSEFKYFEISKIYCLYLAGIIKNGSLTAHEPARSRGIVDPYNEDNIELLSTNFCKYELYKCIEDKNKAGINILRLHMIMEGRVLPELETACDKSMYPGTCDNGRSSIAVESEVVTVLPQSNDAYQQYRFEKTVKGWNLQFGDALLIGVKDWLGMTYIKTLLGCPGEKISVLDLQRIAGESGNVGQQDCEQDGCGGDGVESEGGGVAAWEIIDPTAKGSYLTRLAVIDVEIKDARNAGNQTKIAALIEEAKFIQKELQQGSFKPKDPEIDKNRKRVTKSITDAIANIRKLEALCSFNDKPISSHLKRYIQTGSNCTYMAEMENLPVWKF
jgi:hypothetical protein